MSSQATFADEKQRLRREMLAWRRGLSPQDVQERSARIMGHLESLPPFRRASPLLSYVPFDNEVDLLSLLLHSAAMGRRVYAPRCLADYGLEWRALSGGDALLRGRYGLLEPPSSAPLLDKVSKDGLVLVPGLAFTASGGRLGYGKGYFDRFLADFLGIRVGVLYREQLLPALPREAHDQPLDLLVSELGVTWCGGS